MKFERIRKINKDKLGSSIAIASMIWFLVFAFIFTLNFIIEYIISLNLPIETICYLIFAFGFFCITVYWIYDLLLDRKELDKEELPEIFD
jgi:hypothetical protein